MRIFLSLVLLTLSTTAIPFSYLSQFGQDKYAHEHFFQNKHDGVFVDVGAHDGIAINNTYFLEKELGWTGICIEPNPTVFENLKKNRSCLCIQACAAAQEGVVKFIQAKGYTEMLSGMVHTFDPRHLTRLKREITQHGGSYSIIDVPALNLNTILKEHGFFHIDFLSIDVEGGEFEILKTIDFGTVDVSVICIENNYNDNRQRQFLNSKGFQLVAILGGTDEIYVNDNAK